MDSKYLCIKKVEKTVRLALPSLFVSNEISGVTEILERWKSQYIPELGGVMVNFKNVSILSDAGNININRPFVHYNIRATFDLFCPKVGDIVKGVINFMSREHIGCLLQNTVNISIPLTFELSENLSHILVQGNEIFSEVTHFEFDRKIIRVRGQLTSSCIELLHELYPTTNDLYTASISIQNDNSSQGFKSTMPFDIENTPKEDLGISDTSVFLKSKHKKKRKVENKILYHETTNTNSINIKSKTEYNLDLATNDDTGISEIPEVPKSKHKKKKKRENEITIDGTSSISNLNNVSETQDNCESLLKDDPDISKTVEMSMSRHKKKKKKESEVAFNETSSTNSQTFNITKLIKTENDSESFSSPNKSKKKKKQNDKDSCDLQSSDTGIEKYNVTSHTNSNGCLIKSENDSEPMLCSNMSKKKKTRKDKMSTHNIQSSSNEGVKNNEDSLSTNLNASSSTSNKASEEKKMSPKNKSPVDSSGKLCENVATDISISNFADLPPQELSEIFNTIKQENISLADIVNAIKKEKDLKNTSSSKKKHSKKDKTAKDKSIKKKSKIVASNAVSKKKKHKKDKKSEKEHKDKEQKKTKSLATKKAQNSMEANPVKVKTEST